MIIKVNNSNDIFLLNRGEVITKRNLMEVIILSKVKGSNHWLDENSQINNTPQQGINSIGKYPNIKGVIVKTKKGAYHHDGWNESNSEFKYAFKASKGVVNPNEKANLALTEQPNLKYPIFLFVENRNTWVYEGRFEVFKILSEHVILKVINENHITLIETLNNLSETEFEEGKKT